MATITAKDTQSFVPIREVRDGIVILKDGGLRSLLLGSSINLALKSADEQTAVLAQFQNFLNSLDFTLQFFIESRQLDIRPYIATLEERSTVQTEDLLKIQIQEYIAFIRDFTQRLLTGERAFLGGCSVNPPRKSPPPLLSSTAPNLNSAWASLNKALCVVGGGWRNW